MTRLLKFKPQMVAATLFTVTIWQKPNAVIHNLKVLTQPQTYRDYARGRTLENMTRAMSGQPMARPEDQAEAEKGKRAGTITGGVQIATGALGGLFTPGVKVVQEASTILGPEGQPIVKEVVKDASSVSDHQRATEKGHHRGSPENSSNCLGIGAGGATLLWRELFGNNQELKLKPIAKQTKKSNKVRTVGLKEGAVARLPLVLPFCAIYLPGVQQIFVVAFLCGRERVLCQYYLSLCDSVIDKVEDLLCARTHTSLSLGFANLFVPHLGPSLGRATISAANIETSHAIAVLTGLCG